MAKEKMEALVPAEEQPYEVPNNWRWVYVGAVSRLLRGVSYNKADAHALPGDNDCLIMRGGNIGEGYIDLETDNVYIDKSLVSKDQLIKNHDVIIVGSTGSKKVIGRAGVSDADYNDVAFGAFLITVRPSERINCNYFDLFFQTDVYRERIRNLAAGVNINNIRSEHITKTAIPVPTVEEQQRIVEHVNRMFAELDEAKEKAQAVVDGYDDRKAAILHKAIAGDLSENWRRQNNVSRDTWKTFELKDCGHWMGGGTPSTSHPEYWENGDILWVTSKDMKSDEIEDTLLHTNFLGIENSSAKYSEEPSVLFVMRSGILRRTLPIAMVKKPFCVNQDLKAVAPDKINMDYLFWACTSREKEILRTCMKSGTTVESINADALMKYRIPVPLKEEQEYIVGVISALLEKEQAAVEAANQLIEQVDVVKKSILAKAFRGELGTNDPNEEAVSIA